jgi:hypothetical protein
MELSSNIKSQYNSIGQGDLSFSNTLPQKGSGTLTHRYASLESDDAAISATSHGGRHKLATARTSTGGGRSVILLAVALIVLPMLGLAALLLGLVIDNEIKQADASTDNSLAVDNDLLNHNSYYVDFNPTTLVTIASWSSTVAPLLAVCAMLLVSFPIASQLQISSKTQDSRLPTPYQLGLLLDSLSAGLMPLYNAVSYRRWQHREKLAPSVRLALLLLGSFTALGYTIAAVDTWLHLVIHAVNIEIAEPRSPEAALGRGLPEGSCSAQTTDDFDAGECSITMSGSNAALNGAAEAARVMSNTSSLHAVYETEIDGKHFAYLGPSSMPPGLDYRADALAMQTTCQHIGAQCNLHASNNSISFKCNPSLYGDLSSPTINGDSRDSITGHPFRNAGIVFYRDATLAEPSNTTSPSYLTYPANPQHLAAWARTELPSTPSQRVTHDVVTPADSSSGTTWLLNCTATAHTLTYALINGTLSPSLSVAHPANASTGTILNSPLYYGFGKVSLETAAYAASQYQTPQEMADSWARAYSRASVALSSGVMVGRADLEEMVRRRVLVSRVPKTPLFVLVALNVVYAVGGVVLGVWAWRTVGKGEGVGDGVNDLRERLSTAGLVACAFEGERARRAVGRKRELFGEWEGVGTGRVGLGEAVEGGTVFVLRQRGGEAGGYVG